MSSTIDNICSNIDTRFNSVEELIKICNTYELDTEDTMFIETTLENIKRLKQQYIANTIDILTEYYNTTEDSKKKELHNKFIKAFHSINLVGELDRAYAVFQKMTKIYKIVEDEIPALIKNYELAIIDETFENTTADICPKCQLPYDIEEKTAEYVCKQCGHLEKLSGVVFEDEQFFYQEGQRTKHGKYDPIKHAKFWLERIQAREMTEIPPEIINKIKACIKREQLWIEDITCETIRGYLKKIKKTSYNTHVPLIKKIITCTEPDQLTDYETKLVYMYFGIVIQIYTDLWGEYNCPYHPFFIYKIIEQILKNPKDQMRKKRILSCIHLQSRETLIGHDRTWFAICDKIPEFTKIATGK